MSTRYQLPDWLGGHEVEHRGAYLSDWPIVRMPNGDALAIHVGHLTELPTPPPEPDPGAVVIDREGDAWQRTGGNDRPWAAIVFARQGLPRADWEHLNQEYGPLTRLVRDPADDAPELPWALGSCGRDFTVYKPARSGGTIQLGGACEDYTLDEAERIAVAILGGVRAAREAKP